MYIVGLLVSNAHAQCEIKGYDEYSIKSAHIYAVKGFQDVDLARNGSGEWYSADMHCDADYSSRCAIDWATSQCSFGDHHCNNVDTTTSYPSIIPSNTPSNDPSDMPSITPSNSQSYLPSIAPSNLPSNAPTRSGDGYQSPGASDSDPMLVVIAVGVSILVCIAIGIITYTYGKCRGTFERRNVYNLNGIDLVNYASINSQRQSHTMSISTDQTQM